MSAYKNAEAEHQPLLVISTFNPLIKEDFKWLTIKQTVDAFGNVIYIEHNYEFITKLHKAYNLALNMCEPSTTSATTSASTPSPATATSTTTTTSSDSRFQPI